MPTNDIVTRYLATWNELDPVRPKALVQQTFAPTARYVDPLAASETHAGIDAMIAAVQAKFAGLVFTATGTPDAHARYLRFSWLLGPKGGAPVAGGTDFATIDAEGRLENVTGFLDPVATPVAS